MAVVERGNYGPGAIAGLQHPEGPQRERASPPPPALQVPIGDLQDGQSLRNRANDGNASGIAVIDKWQDQQRGDDQTVASRTCPERLTRRLVSCERLTQQWRVTPLDVTAPELTE